MSDSANFIFVGKEAVMNKIAFLKNIIKEYPWGSHTAIPELLGKKGVYGKPQAEMWMGAHPLAPSMVKTGRRWEPLSDLIKKNPVAILGKHCAEKYKDKLPYLFKVIAAGEPLSIQAHPNLLQAKKGYKRENMLGISPDSYNRNYKDENHKPECLCSLSGFEALCGFRPVSEIAGMLAKACPGTLKKEIYELERNPGSSGLKLFFIAVMKTNHVRNKKILSEAVENSEKFAGENPAFKWVLLLAGKYPENMGIIAPLYLNYLYLKPGEAVFLPAGVLHAYLDGVALELMANSDNVIRGGLTGKHVDVNELTKILKFKSLKNKIILPEENKNEGIYKTPAEEFSLSVISVRMENSYKSLKKRSAEIVLCIDGKAVINDSENRRLDISKGESVVIPASVKEYLIAGNAVLYKAAVNN